MAEDRWWSPLMIEYPFWRDDITPEEFEFERAYYFNIFNRGIIARKNYKSLWKQEKAVKCNLNNSVEVIELAEKMHTMSDEELDKFLYQI